MSNFLNEVFEKLKAKDTTAKVIESGTVYKGFTTIKIQDLPPKKIQSKNTTTEGKKLWTSHINKDILFYQESSPLAYGHSNGFFEAFFQAYMTHSDVKFTPDDVWLTIMLYFTKYVNDHAEELRKAFVFHEGKKQLIVVTVGPDEKDWEPFFRQIVPEVKKNTVPKTVESMQCDFSTSNKFQKLFSAAIIMNSLKKYFDYTRMMAGCGIINAHMGGLLEDWEHLLKKLKNLKSFDVDGNLKYYIKRLEPVLQQFIETYKGNAHIQFWNNIYSKRENPNEEAYEPTQFYDGWLFRFFSTNKNVTEVDALHQIDVDIKLINTFTKITRTVSLVGGCAGVSIDKRVFRPHFSMAVVEKDKKAILEQRLENDWEFRQEYQMKREKQQTKRQEQIKRLKMYAAKPIRFKRVTEKPAKQQLSLNKIDIGLKDQRSKTLAKGTKRIPEKKELPKVEAIKEE